MAVLMGKGRQERAERPWGRRRGTLHTVPLVAVFRSSVGFPDFRKVGGDPARARVIAKLHYSGGSKKQASSGKGWVLKLLVFFLRP